MSSLEQVLKAYEGPDQFFLHNINAHGRISRRGNSFSVRSLLSSRIGDGGAGRSRTDDILLAKQALYQLSYGPIPAGTVAKPRRAVSGSVGARTRPKGLALKQRTTAWFALAPSSMNAGRPGQTRTADLTLIRRAL